MPGRARPTARRVAATVGVGAAVVVLVTGCGLVPTTGSGGVGFAGGGPMMGRAGGGTAPGSGPGMMTGGRSMMGGTSITGSTSTCTAPADLSGTRVTVSLMDMPMMGGSGDPAPLGVPMRLRTDVTSVPAGQVTFVALNLGARTHELVVLPLADGQRPGARVPAADGTVGEDASIGEASASCAAGTGEGISAGSTGWVSVTLAPGRYELLCNEPNHYADGMWTELDVT